MRVRLLRSGNRLVIDPTTPKIKSLICPKLTYVEPVQYRGKEAAMRRKVGLSEWSERVWECYGEDHKGRLGTSYGFKERLIRLLESRGHEVSVHIATHEEAQLFAERLETAYKPRWDRIKDYVKDGFEFRVGQRPALELMTQFQNGRISCPPAWGKGVLILLAAILFPKAKIDVVTDRCAVLLQRLYPALAMALPSVGIIGCKKNIRGRRVMCINADSLHHARPDADFVFVDEGHEACADTYASRLGIYEHARMWAFSASWDMRRDNKNMRAEAMFGPIRLKVTYAEAEKDGLVSPIEIIWDDVVMDVNPCAGIKNDVEKKRVGIWSNKYRNRIIRRIARRYSDDTQVLIPVETLEHALYLKKELPEFTLIHADREIKHTDLKWFRECGLIDENFRDMTTERRAKITRRFERGKLKKVIATTVWNVGVDFTHLEVLIRADAGSSRINDTQIPGRTSRKNAKLMKDGKAVAKIRGIVHDLRDQFDSGFRTRAAGRAASYRKNQWKQHFPNQQDYSKLGQRMGWGNKGKK